MAALPVRTLHLGMRPVQGVVATSRVRGIRAGAGREWRPSAFLRLVTSLHACDGTLAIRMTFGQVPEVQIEVRTQDGVAFPQHRLGWALEASWPSLVFATPEPGGVNYADAGQLPLQLTMLPRPLRLRRRQAGRQQGGGAPVEVELPHPGRWPGGWVGTPFQSPLHSDRWQLELEFAPWSPDQKTRHDWPSLPHGLRRGQWDALSGTDASQVGVVDTGADGDLQEYLRAWLTRPDQGFTVRGWLRAATAFDDWAVRRIIGDVFGQLPVDVLADPVGAPARATGAGCFLPLQGEGGWMPLPEGLMRSGVPLSAMEPGVLPAGPGLVLGETAGGQPVVLPDSVRAGHLLVVGASGTGKSTSLCRMITEDIEAGHGTMLLDPHGDLFERVLGAVPLRRRDDVVAIDIGHPTHSVARNPLQGAGLENTQRAFLAGSIVDLVDHLFEGQDTSGPVLRNHLRHALLLAMCHPNGGTLADANRIFLEPDFRKWLLQQADERVRTYFKRFQVTDGEYGFANWLPYILARFEPFSSSQMMLSSLSRPSSIDLPALMRQRAIVLIRVPRSEMTETECRVFGALVLLSCFRAAMDQGGLARRQEGSCRMFVDEFHLFATPAVASLLREARKFGLCLTVATQSFGSLRQKKAPNLINDVLTNTASKLLFRTSPIEAAVLEEYTAPSFDARTLARLANRQAALVLSSLGLEPLGLRTLPPQSRDQCADSAKLLEASVRRHGTPMSEVLDYLERRHGFTAE